MIKRLSKILAKWPSQKALLFGCLCALLGLAIMVWSILVPKPLVVVMGMSVSQGFLGVGLGLFLFTVMAEYLRDTHHDPPAGKAP